MKQRSRHMHEGIEKPCPFCGEWPWVENCDDSSPCNCGWGWIFCDNEDCPEEPDGLNAPTHTERVENWNDGKFEPEPRP